MTRRSETGAAWCTCGHLAAEHTPPRGDKPRGICWAQDCGCKRYEDEKEYERELGNHD